MQRCYVHIHAASPSQVSYDTAAAPNLTLYGCMAANTMSAFGAMHLHGCQTEQQLCPGFPGSRLTSEQAYALVMPHVNEAHRKCQHIFSQSLDRM